MQQTGIVFLLIKIMRIQYYYSSPYFIAYESSSSEGIRGNIKKKVSISVPLITTSRDILPNK